MSKLIQAGSVAAVVVLLSVAPAFAGIGVPPVRVPEPSSLALLGAGGVAAMLYRKFRGK